MEKPLQRCLIKNRFKAIDCPDRVEIFDQQSPQKNDKGQTMPVGVIPVKAKQTACNACRIALRWLHSSLYISTGDYLVETERLMVHASVQPLHYAEKPDKDCID